MAGARRNSSAWPSAVSSRSQAGSGAEGFPPRGTMRASALGRRGPVVSRWGRGGPPPVLPLE